MKVLHFSICVSIFLFTSCVKPKSEGVVNVSTDSLQSVTVIDPDTTDTVPSERYGIYTCKLETSEIVRKSLNNLFQNDLAKDLIAEPSKKFIMFEYDLNNDERKEIFVGLTGSYFCGSGGCTILLLSAEGKLLTKFTVSDYPIVIDKKTTKGWKDLYIYSAGNHHIIKWNGEKYPSNPSVEPILKQIPGDDLTRALNFINEPYPWFRF